LEPPWAKKAAWWRRRIVVLISTGERLLVLPS
jgi:hypothetical protein